MRLVYIYKSFAMLAGTERILTDKINYLADNCGYEIFVITFEQGAHPIAYPLSEKVKVTDLNCRFFTLGKEPAAKRLFAFLKLKQKFRKLLRKNVKKFDPDFVICTTYSLNILDCIVSLPYKVIVESHVYKPFELPSTANPLLKPIFNIYSRRLISSLKKSKCLVTLTQRDADAWYEIKNKVVIPNILTYFPKEIKSDNCKHRIILAGRLNDQKGYDLFIKAWAKIADKYSQWKVDIFGNGGDYDMLMSMIESNDLQNSVTINQPTPKIYDEYFNSDFLVLSSRYEGFGLVLIEAMSCGLPCVSFDCPCGPAEIIEDKKTGILVDNGNIEALANAISWMIEHDEERAEMGKEARIAAQRYTQDNIMSRWVKLFEELRES